MERTGRSQNSPRDLRVALKIRINPAAVADLIEIKNYVAQDNPEAASRLIHTIYSSIEKLAEFPKIGASLSSKIEIKTDYRYLVCGSYIVIYKAEGDFVSVYRVLNGMRNYLSIIFADELSKAAARIYML